MNPSDLGSRHAAWLARSYFYLLVLVPGFVIYLIYALLPTWASDWLASDAPYDYVPTKEHLLLVGLRFAMALDAAFILYALLSFRLPKPRASSLASAALVGLLPAVLATKAFPSLPTGHRALLYAALPPFLALVATLAPFLRPRPPPPLPPGPQPVGEALDGPHVPGRDYRFPPGEEEGEEEGAPPSEYDDDEWDT